MVGLPADAQAYLTEAHNLADLDHPNNRAERTCRDRIASRYLVVSWNGGSSFAVFSTVAVSFELFGLS